MMWPQLCKCCMHSHLMMCILKECCVGGVEILFVVITHWCGMVMNTLGVGRRL